MNYKLNILNTDLFSEYCEDISEVQLNVYNTLVDSELTKENFNFYTSVSAVYSSKIEGVEIEMDSYLKHKCFGVKYLPDYTRKTDDLYAAYIFAQENKLSKNNIEHAHKLVSKHLVSKNEQGKIRNSNMFVVTVEGKIEYVAASPLQVIDEIEKFYEDLEILLNIDLNIQEVFFFSAYLHLVFVKIHPFNDGNGRTARLIEKWFLAEKLGEKAWFIQSERNYYEQHQVYYNNLRRLGLEYDTLDYNLAFPFLQMLPKSLTI